MYSTVLESTSYTTQRLGIGLHLSNLQYVLVQTTGLYISLHHLCKGEGKKKKLHAFVIEPFQENGVSYKAL